MALRTFLFRGAQRWGLRMPMCAVRPRHCIDDMLPARCTFSSSTLPPPAQERDPYAPPTRGQLLKLGLVASVPYVGFGFMDNFIMIVAGDAIDASIGVKLGISTM